MSRAQVLVEHGAVRSYLEPVVQRAREAGPLPRPGSAEWLDADDATRLAAVLAEALRHREAATLRFLVLWDERERAAADVVRQASHAVSAALDWSAVASTPSHAELVRRRAVVL